eukprot:Gb_17456 [translate_table: standard]
MLRPTFCKEFSSCRLKLRKFTWHPIKLSSVKDPNVLTSGSSLSSQQLERSKNFNFLVSGIVESLLNLEQRLKCASTSPSGRVGNSTSF